MAATRPLEPGARIPSRGEQRRTELRASYSLTGVKTLIVILVVAGSSLTVVGMVLLMFPQVVRDNDGDVFVELLDGNITDLWKKPVLGTMLGVLGSLLNSSAAIFAVTFV